MISQEFEFYAPKRLSDALALLQRHGEDAKLLAGGMTLMPMMTLGLLRPRVVISLNHVGELDFVSDGKNMLRIGAMTRHGTIAKNELVRERFPLLATAAGHIGDVQVRHRGTIGGSLSHADPAADYPVVMLATNAQFKLRSAKGERKVKARDFFKGLMHTDLREGEVLTEVQVPSLPDGTGSAYLRLHRVEGNFPIVNAAAVIEKNFKSARIALGGIGLTAVVIDVSKRLTGGLTEQALREVSEDAFTASRDAYSDLNGDADYRRAMARVYAKRVIEAAAAAMH